MYDVIIIGGGLGYVAAIVLSKTGKKVALIEKNLDHIGGTCLHNGCIPSKNLLHRAKTLIESKEEVFEGNLKLNLAKLQEKIKKIIQKNTKAILNQLKIAGVDIIEGEGFITDEGVKIDGKTLKSTYTIIATGSTPRIPQGIEYDKKRVITSDEALNFKEIPQEISIYGSGAIGLEMASFFAAAGSSVNLIYRHERISNKFPKTITQNIETQLKNIGVNLIPNTQINEAKTINDWVVCKTDKNEFKTPFLLVAAGREPNISAVKTDKIKVNKAIVTDEYFQTTMPGVFAVGDCNGKLLLAHAARAQALNVASNILGKKEKLILENIPKFIYTLPLSYASIGVRSENLGEFPLSNLGISGSLYGDKLGIVRLYFDNENFLCGGDILAPNAEELIGILSSAVAGESDINILKNAVFPHPTYSEAIDRAIRRVK